jgi:large-conductance mechanosensitive channel
MKRITLFVGITVVPLKVIAVGVVVAEQEAKVVKSLVAVVVAVCLLASQTKFMFAESEVPLFTHKH